MNLSIKDLEVAKDLSCEERAAVRGGDAQGNGAVHTIGQLQNVLVPVAAGTGAGRGGGGINALDFGQGEGSQRVVNVECTGQLEVDLAAPARRGIRSPAAR